MPSDSSSGRESKNNMNEQVKIVTLIKKVKYGTHNEIIKDYVRSGLTFEVFSPRNPKDELTFIILSGLSAN